jgi:hypothetical protein
MKKSKPSKFKRVRQHIEKTSSEVAAVATSSMIFGPIRKRDGVSSGDIQQLFSHYASIHSVEGLTKELKMIAKDIQASAPHAMTALKEVSQIRKKLVGKILDRIREADSEQ